MPRRDFMVLYDYGQGGLWAIIRADTVEQVRQRYPQLQVFEERPAFLDDELLGRIREQCCCDVDEPPAGWLAQLPA
jgi:hypothetical protein